MNSFAQSAIRTSNETLTENGHPAFRSTSNALLDLFGVIGGLRNAEPERITRLFDEAYKVNPLLATKILFYSRDIRGGLGERETFRTILKHAAIYHPECVEPNLDLIGVYGRFDDLYCLINTPLEDKMWEAMKTQLDEDLKNLEEGNSVSLLGKWIKTPDASSQNTRALGILTAKKLGYSVYDFKRILRSLRKEIDIVERHMSAGEWDQIKYSEVPSRAMFLYKNAFARHNEKDFIAFIQKAVTGEAKINSSTLFPYDITEKYLDRFSAMEESENLTYEAQWRQLPNYIEEGKNVMVLADVSGSMSGRPMASSVGLALYFAERNTGDFHNLFMTFTSTPKVVKVKGDTLASKIESIADADWGGSTNLVEACLLILKIAKENNVPEKDMPLSLVIISDMEIDAADDSTTSLYPLLESKFALAGYKMPTLVFWNVNSRSDTFLIDHDRPGVLLCSGQSPSTFKQLMASIGMSAEEMMLNTLNSDRYDAISISDYEKEGQIEF